MRAEKAETVESEDWAAEGVLEAGWFHRRAAEGARAARAEDSVAEAVAGYRLRVAGPAGWAESGVQEAGGLHRRAAQEADWAQGVLPLSGIV